MPPSFRRRDRQLPVLFARGFNSFAKTHTNVSSCCRSWRGEPWNGSFISFLVVILGLESSYIEYAACPAGVRPTDVRGRQRNALKQNRKTRVFLPQAKSLCLPPIAAFHTWQNVKDQLVRITLDWNLSGADYPNSQPMGKLDSVWRYKHAEKIGLIADSIKRWPKWGKY